MLKLFGGYYGRIIFVEELRERNHINKRNQNVRVDFAKEYLKKDLDTSGTCLVFR